MNLGVKGKNSMFHFVSFRFYLKKKYLRLPNSFEDINIKNWKSCKVDSLEPRLYFKQEVPLSNTRGILYRYE